MYLTNSELEAILQELLIDTNNQSNNAFMLGTINGKIRMLLSIINNKYVTKGNDQE